MNSFAALGRSGFWSNIPPPNALWESTGGWMNGIGACIQILQFGWGQREKDEYLLFDLWFVEKAKVYPLVAYTAINFQREAESHVSALKYLPGMFPKRLNKTNHEHNLRSIWCHSVSHITFAH